MLTLDRCDAGISAWMSWFSSRVTDELWGSSTFKHFSVQGVPHQLEKETSHGQLWLTTPQITTQQVKRVCLIWCLLPGSCWAAEGQTGSPWSQGPKWPDQPYAPSRPEVEADVLRQRQNSSPLFWRHIPFLASCLTCWDPLMVIPLTTQSPCRPEDPG